MQDIIDKEIILQKRQQELKRQNEYSQFFNQNNRGLSYSNLYQAPPLTVSSLYEDYSTGQISMLEALEKRDQIIQWSRMINSTSILSNQSSITRQNLDESINQLQDQNARKQRHAQEVLDSISKESMSKYRNLNKNEKSIEQLIFIQKMYFLFFKVYKDFKNVLKLNLSQIELTKKSRDVYDIDNLDPLKSTPREQLDYPKGQPLIIQTELVKAGNFFFDQPIKDHKTFMFSHCFKNKEHIIKYLNDELKMREHHQSSTTYNQIKGVALKRLDEEIKILKELIKGLLLNNIELELYNTRYYRYKIQLKQTDTNPKKVVNEFILMLDFVNELPFTAEKVRIKYGFFRKGFKQEANRTTNEHFVDDEGEKCFIKEQENVIFPDKKLDYFIYFQILVFHQKQKLPENVGWSVHKILNKKNFVDFGQFQIPFYEHRLQLESVLNDYQKNVGPIRLCFSILPYNHEIQESPYKMADYYRIENYFVPEIHLEDRLSVNLKNQIHQEQQSKQELKDQRRRQLYEETFKENPQAKIKSVTSSITSLQEQFILFYQIYGLIYNFKKSIKEKREPRTKSYKDFVKTSQQSSLSQDEIDRFIRLSKDFSFNSNELLKSINMINNNQFSTIKEENNEEQSQLID